MSYWMIAVPNEKSATADNTFRTLDERTKQYSKNYQFRIPTLKVGTLDTLMALSDDLQKYDIMVGGIAKKIEKTYLEVYKNEPQADAKTAETPELRVGQQTPKDYVEKFKWNDKRYRDPATLRNIADSIVKEAIKADESLKKQQSEYNEVRAAVTALERKDTGSLLVRSLAPYVKEKDIIEKEFLTTLLVVVPKAKDLGTTTSNVVPKAKDLEWQQEYEILEDIQEKREAEEKKRKDEEAAIRAEKDRQAALEAANKENKSTTQGTVAKKPADLKKTNSTSTTVKKQKSSVSINSTGAATPSAVSSAATDEKEAAVPTTTPATKVNTTKKKAEKEEKKTTRLKQCKSVVPSSAKRLTEDDEYVLYRIVVLKNGVDHYKNLLRERRYTVRPFKYDPDEEKKSKEEKNMLIKKKTALWNYLIRWCTTTYAEIFASWIHIKAIRLYVEAVLRYGLPVNLCFALLEPRKGYEKQVRDTLQNLYAKLASANLTQALDANETDLSGFGSDFYPYVYLPLTLYD